MHSGGGIVRRAGRPLAFIAVYVLAAKATEGLTLENGFTPWYPPAGLTLAYLIVVGPRGALTVATARLVNIAIIFPDAWRDEPDGVIARAVAISACYALGAHVLRRSGLDRARLRELGLFAAVGVVAVPFGAALSVAMTSALLLGESASDAFDSALTVWIGDAVAIATIVPLVLLFLAARQGRIRAALPVSKRDRAEAGLLLVALVAAPVGALALARERDAAGFLSLAVIPVIWAGVRGDLLLGALGLFVANASLTIAAGAWLGDTARMSELQVVMLLSAMSALYVAVATHANQVAMQELAASEDRYRTLVDNVPSLIVRFDRDGAVRFANEPTWLVSTGGVESVVEPLRRGLARLLGPDAQLGSTAERTWEVVAADGEVSWYSARLRREPEGWGEPGGIVAVITDLTPERHVEAELDRARWRDPLTGLVNRQRFLDLLEPLAALDGETLGVAIIDIDGFKGINELLGHAGADRILVEVAGRLRDKVGGTGFAARLAADEFAVTLPVAGPEDAAALGQSLVRDLRVRVPLDAEGELFVTCSVGVACSDGEQPAISVFFDAESALSAAKETGRDRAASFETGHRAAALERSRRLALIHQAIDRQEVIVHYQPIVRLDTRAPLGVEALVRLADPRGGILLPGAFIDLVEEAGLDSDLGAIVLEQALRDLAGWPAAVGGVELMMSVNVTSRQLTSPGYVHRVLSACQRHGIAPHRVRLELTESMVMADLDAAVAALHELRTSGITAALDDFGVGYSSMTYVQRLPIDVLKIDRSFVAGLPDDDDDRSIVGLVLGLAQALGLEVTAEGIETEAQRQVLMEMGCERGQGFLFDRPVDATAILARLAPATAGDVASA